MSNMQLRCEQVAVYIATLLEPQWLIGERVSLCEDELYLNSLICVLSSQVPYEIARSYADSIFRHGRKQGTYVPLSHQKVLGLLKRPVLIDGRNRYYRFPNTRATWISNNQLKLISNRHYFSKIIYSGTDPIKLRLWLCSNVLGLGLKQASMFIQIALKSDCFAILDRHILRYLDIIGLLPRVPSSISARTYLEIEDLFIRHARFRGFGTDLFDHATWITMRSMSKAA